MKNGKAQVNLPVVVHKYGGWAMQTDESREWVVHHINQAVQNGFRVIVVVSAMGRKGDPYATDTLLSLGEWEAQSKELNLIKSCGEFISVSVLTALLKKNKIPCNLLYGKQAGLVQGEEDVSVQMEDCSNSVENFAVTLVPGFQYVDSEGIFYTFERGGSDYSALLYAQNFECETVFFKDVAGVYYPQDSNQIVTMLTHEQLCELEVIQKRAALFAALHQIPLTIRSFYSDVSHTIIRTPLHLTQ